MLLVTHLPASPFSTPFLKVVDAVRVFSCLLSAFVFGRMLVVLLSKKMRVYQRLYGTGHLAFCLTTFLVELARLGHSLSWRLPVSIIGVSSVLIALYLGEGKGAIF